MSVYFFIQSISIIINFTIYNYLILHKIINMQPCMTIHRSLKKKITLVDIKITEHQLQFTQNIS